MSAFGESLRLFGEKAEARTQAVFDGATEEVQRSVVEGSEITGAPGQPVDTGALKGSWIPELESSTSWVTQTNLDYAEPIEDGIGPYGPMTLRSKVGGFHSVALTRGGWGRIVEVVRERVVGND